MNIRKLLFVGMSVDMNMHTNIKLLYVCYFFKNSSKLYIYSSGGGSIGSHSSNLDQWFSHRAL
jgi:hypothetical protein